MAYTGTRLTPNKSDLAGRGIQCSQGVYTCKKYFTLPRCIVYDYNSVVIKFCIKKSKFLPHETNEFHTFTICSLFRTNRGFPSRSSGIWSSRNRSVKKKGIRPTIQPSNHPTIKDTLSSSVNPPIFVFFLNNQDFFKSFFFSIEKNSLYFHPQFFFYPYLFSTFLMIFFAPTFVYPFFF